jgi:hypothetical protein
MSHLEHLVRRGESSGAGENLRNSLFQTESEGRNWEDGSQFFKDFCHKNWQRGGIPRWWPEGGSRKCASNSELLERHWRHTLQAKPLRRGKTLTPPHLQLAQRISTSR